MALKELHPIDAHEKAASSPEVVDEVDGTAVVVVEAGRVVVAVVAAVVVVEAEVVVEGTVVHRAE